MNKPEEGGSGGNPSKPKEKPKEEPKKDQSVPKEEGDSDFDELGYAKSKNDQEQKSEPKKDKSKEDDKKQEDSTGYEAEIPAKKEEDTTGYTDDDDGEKDGGDNKESEQEESELELDTKDLLPDEVKAIKEFAKKHKLTKEAAQAMADSKKAEIQAIKAAMKKQEREKQEAVNETKRAWRKELMEDSTFGGENFDKNIHKANKVVGEFLPNTKKMLTERRTMLPPYVMRDLVKLADHLYGTEGLVNGEPTVSKKKEEESDNPLDFYNS